MFTCDIYHHLSHRGNQNWPSNTIPGIPCQHGLSKTGGDLRDPHWRCKGADCWLQTPRAKISPLQRHRTGQNWWPEQPHFWQTSYTTYRYYPIFMDRWMEYPIWYIEYILRILYLYNIQMSGKCKWIEERLEFRPQRWEYHHQEWGKWFRKKVPGKYVASFPCSREVMPNLWLVWKSETGLKWGLTWTCDSIGYHRTGFIDILDSASRAHTWVMMVPLIAIIVIVDNPMWYNSTAVFSRMMSL